MQRLQAFQFELIPIGHQVRNMRRYARSCRFVFNKALTWRGGLLVAVDPKYTSRTCPAGLQESNDNSMSQAKFECVYCGYANNAGVVGAINILARGHRVLACGEDVRRTKVVKPKRATSAKQEPAEVTKQGEIHA